MDTKTEELETRLQDLEKQVEILQQNIPEDQLSMVVFSGDLDRLLAALIIATGAAAMYERVVMFFTFWGVPPRSLTCSKSRRSMNYTAGAQQKMPFGCI